MMAKQYRPSDRPAQEKRLCAAASIWQSPLPERQAGGWQPHPACRGASGWLAPHRRRRRTPPFRCLGSCVDRSDGTRGTSPL